MRTQKAAWKIEPDGSGLKRWSEFPLRLKLLRAMGKQTWIPHGQDWVMRKLWDPDSEKSFCFEVDFFGMRYQGDMAQFADWKVFGYGCHAYSELSLLKALTQEIRAEKGEVTFFDIGANVGHHTLFMAGQADRVIAFEPFGEIRKLVEQKIAMNGLTNVQLMPYALGAADEVLQYYPGGAVNSGTGTFRPQEIGTYQPPVEVEVRNGDGVCEAFHLPRIDLMKVDVEGFEPFVFRGLANRIRSDRPPVLTELSDRSRETFGSEAGFRDAFWEGAVIAEVTGREGCPFKLRPFHFETADEVLIVPPERGDFVRRQMQA